MSDPIAPRHRRRWTSLALVLLVAVVAAFHAARMIRAELALTEGELSFPLDDSFIYLQYARAIAEGHPFVYTPGNEPTTGATSVWYPLLLVPPHLLGLSPGWCIAWALALGLLGYVSSALLSARLGHRLGGFGGGALALVLFLSSPFVLWGYLSGMETALYGTALLGTSLAYVRERSDGRFPTFRWWLFLLAGSRPEGAVLTGVLGIFAAFDRRTASRRQGGPRFWSPALVLPLVAAALPFAINLLVSGSIESTSSQAKSILAELYPDTRRAFLAGAPRVWREVAALFLSMLQPVGRDVTMPAFLGNAIPAPSGSVIPASLAVVNGAAVALFLLLALLPRRPWERGTALLALVGVGIVLQALPVLRFAQFFRYQHGLYTLFLVVLAVGWGRLAWLAWSRAPSPVRVPSAALALVLPLSVWSIHLAPELERLPRSHARQCENTFHQQVVVGRWIDRNLAPDARIGFNDAGAIAYYARRSTVDLVGITSAGYALPFRAGRGVLFEHLRRQPAERLPTHFAIHPLLFPWWPESGILGPELFRAHLQNNVNGEADKVVFLASRAGLAVDRPVGRQRGSAAASSRRMVDSLDVGWLEEERRHQWSTAPEARDVLRRYPFSNRPTRVATDAGRVASGWIRFRVDVAPGRDLEMVMRTDAWMPSRLRVRVDGKDAGAWEIPRSETAWIEPGFTIAGALVTSARPEIRLEREPFVEGQNWAPFHFWFYQ